MANLLHREEPLQVGTSPHRTAIYFGHTKGRAFGGNEYVGSPCHADSATQHKTVDRENDGLGISVYRFKGVVVALVDRHNFGRLSTQFLDVDTRTKPFAFCADHDHANRILFTEGFDLCSDTRPLRAVERIHRRLVQDQMGDALVNVTVKRHLQFLLIRLVTGRGRGDGTSAISVVASKSV